MCFQHHFHFHTQLMIASRDSRRRASATLVSAAGLVSYAIRYTIIKWNTKEQHHHHHHHVFVAYEAPLFDIICIIMFIVVDCHGKRIVSIVSDSMLSVTLFVYVGVRMFVSHVCEWYANDWHAVHRGQQKPKLAKLSRSHCEQLLSRLLYVYML